jgi:hypothetical protein
MHDIKNYNILKRFNFLLKKLKISFERSDSLKQTIAFRHNFWNESLLLLFEKWWKKNPKNNWSKKRKLTKSGKDWILCFKGKMAFENQIY